LKGFIHHEKITWIYLASYLSIGGFGFAFAPEIALKLFMSGMLVQHH